MCVCCVVCGDDSATASVFVLGWCVLCVDRGGRATTAVCVCWLGLELGTRCVSVCVGVCVAARVFTKPNRPIAAHAAQTGAWCPVAVGFRPSLVSWRRNPRGDPPTEPGCGSSHPPAARPLGYWGCGWCRWVCGPRPLRLGHLRRSPMDHGEVRGGCGCSPSRAPQHMF